MHAERTCEKCGQPYTPHRNDQKRCSPCSRIAHGRPAQHEPMACCVCGTKFVPLRKDKKYCGTQCANRWHYERMRSELDTTNPLCTHPSCGRRLLAPHHKYCGMHYARSREGRDMDAPAGFRSQRLCEVDGCERPHRSNGFCGMHLARWKRWGDPLVVKKRPNGTPQKDPRTGYVYRYRKAVHRQEVEDALGRLLMPWETVHHRNGVRDDNRPENLELWASPSRWRGSHHPHGQRVTDLVAFVVQNYPEEVKAALAVPADPSS